ncbi:hypothetical protein GF373_15225 [bacterium]|nr:hypothetical protein [bacterium]
MRTACFFLITIALSCQISLAAFDWETDFEKAMKRGQKINKPVMAYFYHSLGRLKDEKVWKSPLLQKYNSSFIPVQLNINNNGEIIQKYNLVSFPSVLFFDTKGREILSCRFEDDRLTRTRLLLHIKKALENMEKFALIEDQIELMKNNPKMVLLYAKGLRDRAQFQKAEEQFKKLFAWKDLDPKILEEAQSSYSHMMLFRASRYFYGGEYEKCIEEVQRYLSYTPQTDYNLQAKYLLGISYYEVGSKREGKKVLQEVLKEDKNDFYTHKIKRYLQRN